MSAGTQVEWLGKALKSELIPPGHCQAEPPDINIWAVFGHLYAAEYLHVKLHPSSFCH